jgi:transcription termination factor Rho
MSDTPEITDAPADTSFPPAPENTRPAPPKKRAVKKTTKVAVVAKAALLPAKKRASRAVVKKALEAEAVASAAPSVAHEVNETPASSAPVADIPATVQDSPPEAAQVIIHQAPAETITETSAPASEPHIISSAPPNQAPVVTVSTEATASPTGDPPHGEQRPPREERRHWRDRQRDRRRNRELQQQGGQPQQQHGQQNDQQQREPQPERPLGPPEPADGILEITPKGFGFLRQRSNQYAQIPQDPFVGPEWVRKYGLREGMFIKGISRMGARGPQITEISEIMGGDPEKARDLPLFEELKAVNPNKRIQLETRPDRLTTRVIDMFTPVGRGQRGLIVAPPRAGKTTILEHMAEAIVQNHPTMHLMILLVDERPEEVTEFRRALPNAEIHASSNDSDVKNHMRTAMFAIERAKRLVEAGQHVFMLLDSITRMGRAFNNGQRSGGPTMSGGVGVGALEMPRRLFAAARNTREAGSLTILATTLIETGSKMDELIFQEFKGTGNFELVLDRKIAEQYIYPAVNIFRSGTRREELLLPAFQMEKIHVLRRGLGGHKPMEAIQRVITLMERAPNNNQMLVDLPGKVS